MVSSLGSTTRRRDTLNAETDVETRIDCVFEPPLGMLILSGEFDVSARTDLSKSVRRLEQVRQLHVDAGGVTFVDCACLSVLEQARRDLARSRRELHVVRASESFLRIVTLAGYPGLDLAKPPLPAAVRTANLKPHGGWRLLAALVALLQRRRG